MYNANCRSRTLSDNGGVQMISTVGGHAVQLAMKIYCYLVRHPVWLFCFSLLINLIFLSLEST